MRVVPCVPTHPFGSTRLALLAWEIHQGIRARAAPSPRDGRGLASPVPGSSWLCARGCGTVAQFVTIHCIMFALSDISLSQFIVAGCLVYFEVNEIESVGGCCEYCERGCN